MSSVSGQFSGGYATSAFRSFQIFCMNVVKLASVLVSKLNGYA